MADVVSGVRVGRTADDAVFEAWLHDDGDAYRIHRTCYRSEEILALEKAQVFARTWNLACLTSEVSGKGDYITLQVADQPVLVVRGGDGAIRAFQNACTHRGAMVTDERRGQCGAVFKCMYHAWSFDLEGRLVGVPYPEAYGDDFDRAQLGLAPVRCETFGDLVFVNLSDDTPSLREYLGDFAPRLEPQVTGVEAIGRNSWIYEGNWKLWHENFRDNYHPQFTHRWINDTMPKYAERGGNWGFDNGHSVLQWVTPPPYAEPAGYQRALEKSTGVRIDVEKMTQFDAIWAHRDKSLEDLEGEVIAVFPNIDVQPDPYRHRDGRLTGLKNGFIQMVVPLGVERSRVDLIVYANVESSPEERAALLANYADTQGSWGRISVDDTEAAERTQIGLRAEGTTFSNMGRGVTLPPYRGGDEAQARDEYSIRVFYEAYRQYLRGTK